MSTGNCDFMLDVSWFQLKILIWSYGWIAKEKRDEFGKGIIQN